MSQEVRTVTEPTYTHKATVTITSDGINDDVAISIKWDPDLEGANISQLGYLPSSYQFVQQYVLPMLEDAWMASPEVLAEPGKRN